MTELEDALVLIKQKKQKAIPAPDFIQMVDSELDKGKERFYLKTENKKQAKGNIKHTHTHTNREIHC
jgi:hypothetical protein